MSAAAMQRSRFYKSNIVAGFAPLALGLAIMVQSYSYGMGNLRVIGPGVYPLLLGGVLAALGVAILLIEAPSPDQALSDKIEWRSLCVIAASILSFALTIETLGLFPAVMIGAWISGWADDEATILRNAILGLCVAAFCSFVFILCLQLPIPLFEF